MGTDIHIAIEIKKGDTWELHDWQEPYNTGETHPDGSPKRDYHEMMLDPFCIGRNYNLFAILADVRNGVGFAGTDTGDGFVPIANPRGIPVDSVSIQEVDEEGWGHDFSWLGLDELLNYDWHGQTTKHRGVVDVLEYFYFKEHGQPRSWSGGGSMEIISNEEMDKRYDAMVEGLRDGPVPFSPQTVVEWEESYYESCKFFVDKTIPALQALSDNPANVRILFFFDS